ncbi:MAG: hypothetical protein AAGE59_16780 [Cyanobacteria bacterium P01_F01_bin.86]
MAYPLSQYLWFGYLPESLRSGQCDRDALLQVDRTAQKLIRGV